MMDRPTLEAKLKNIGAIVGNTPEILKALESVLVYADADDNVPLPVLILGESGTGKELIARALHQNSRRSEKPFVALNCAGLNESTLKSELFGHVHGAFTGADTNRDGYFKSADHGTLFLDEIGDMPMAMQAALLRVLQDRQITRLGSNEPIQVDVRFISATNKNLEEAIAKGEFRNDLYFRIKGATIALAPLRERREDIPLLLAHALRQTEPSSNRPYIDGIDEDCTKALVEFDWPGNVRELMHVVKDMALRARSQNARTITVAHLPEGIRTFRPTDQPPPPVNHGQQLEDGIVLRVGGNNFGDVEAYLPSLPQEISHLNDAERNLLEEYLKAFRQAFDEAKGIRGKVCDYNIAKKIRKRQGNGYYSDTGWKKYLHKFPRVENIVHRLKQMEIKYHATVDKIGGPFVDASKGQVLSRSDLLRKKESDIAFRILLLFPKDGKDRITIERVAESKDSRHYYTLDVRLDGSEPGIFRNSGKRHVLSRCGLADALTDTQFNTLRRAAETAHDFIMGRDDTKELSWSALTSGLGSDPVPLRWASAGALPVIRARGRRYVALFWRDIPPIGLNVANGASENCDEWWNIDHLLRREFCEELMLLQKKPAEGQSVVQIPFRSIDWPYLSPKEAFAGYLKLHSDLRRHDDGVTLSCSDELQQRVVTAIPTNFQVRVSDSPPDCRKSEARGAVIFSINPFEMGIEVIALYQFDLKVDEGEWLIDGEVLPSWSMGPNRTEARTLSLVRRPVVLIDVDFLKGQRDADGSIKAEIRYDDPCRRETKQLPEIPSDKIIVFHEEKWLQERLRFAENDERKKFFEKCDQELRAAANGDHGLPGGYLTTLCPVAWKTLEAALRMEYFTGDSR